MRIPSPEVAMLWHDVAPDARRRAFATRLDGCGARCRCWSDAQPERTCHMRNTSAANPDLLIMSLPGRSVRTPGWSWSVPPGEDAGGREQSEERLVRRRAKR